MNGISKLKAQLEMNLAMEMKGSKKVHQWQKEEKENVGLLPNGVGNQVMKDMEKDEVLKPFFALFYWQGLLSGLPGHLVQKENLGE